MSQVLSIQHISSERPQVPTWGRQTCFLPRAPSNLVTPLLSAHAIASFLFWGNAWSQYYKNTVGTICKTWWVIASSSTCATACPHWSRCFTAAIVPQTELVLMSKRNEFAGCACSIWCPFTKSSFRFWSIFVWNGGRKGLAKWALKTSRDAKSSIFWPAALGLIRKLANIFQTRWVNRKAAIYSVFL